MKFTVFLFGFVPLHFAFYHRVVAAPVPLDLHLLYFAPIVDTTLKSVQEEINTHYIPAMMGVLDNPKVQKNKDILQMAFGKGSQDPSIIKILKDSLQKFKTGSLNVARPEHPKQLYGEWVIDKKELVLHTPFFGTSLHASPQQMKEMLTQQVAIMFHEASHAFFETVDHFDKNFKPLPTPAGHKHQGYLANDFKVVRDKGGAKACVHNADSWLVFAHVAYAGNVDLLDDPRSRWSLS